MNKIDEKVKKFLEYDLQPTMRGGWKITEEMCVLIHEIAEECNKLEVTQKINMDIPEWLEEADPKSLYTCSRRWFLRKQGYICFAFREFCSPL